MVEKKNPWSDPDLHRDDQSADPSKVEPRDHQQKPTHEQSNAPGSQSTKKPSEPYPDRSR
ncbi:hypothetical protein LQT97_13520 [Brucella pseudogrignonensis]|jgi:hypothetical protein|nr:MULTISPECIES: hypothetical protein [Brucella]MBK0022828.1 hypothetical protein [Ochrobactrum sp. S45]MBK0044843.1 hypothetical protein [Ochrobactrum sp. S46]MBO1027061.1 hypothetical protein [Ochrobactrum sp. SD129]ANG98623.1 hypothetical protein A8A54_18525 [Brucella pseudogrignonensis]KAB2689472.1 hypothetical protein F9K82_12795 [Brucella pseudogrignonensis]